MSVPSLQYILCLVLCSIRILTFTPLRFLRTERSRLNSDKGCVEYMRHVQCLAHTLFIVHMLQKILF